MKIKWLAWIYAGFLLLGFVVNSMSYRLAMIAAFSNYFIFFGPEVFHQLRHRKEVATRRKRFEVQSARAETEPLHRCANCGATEVSHPDLEFRVSQRRRGVLPGASAERDSSCALMALPA